MAFPISSVSFVKLPGLWPGCAKHICRVGIDESSSNGVAKKALIALARKILTIIYVVLTT